MNDDEEEEEEEDQRGGGRRCSMVRQEDMRGHQAGACGLAGKHMEKKTPPGMSGAGGTDEG